MSSKVFRVKAAGQGQWGSRCSSTAHKLWDINLKEKKKHNKWEAITQPLIQSLSAADIIHILRKQIRAGSGILHISVNVLYVRCWLKTHGPRGSHRVTRQISHDTRAATVGLRNLRLSRSLPVSCWDCGQRTFSSRPVRSSPGPLGSVVNSVMCNVYWWAAELLYLFLNKVHSCFYWDPDSFRGHAWKLLSPPRWRHGFYLTVQRRFCRVLCIPPPPPPTHPPDLTPFPVDKHDTKEKLGVLCSTVGYYTQENGLILPGIRPLVNHSGNESFLSKQGLKTNWTRSPLGLASCPSLTGFSSSPVGIFMRK